MCSRILLGVAALLISVSPGEACSIPVFRYALERWGLGPYEVIVYHKGALDGDGEAVVKKINDTKANVHVTTVDLAGKVEPALAKWWDKYGDKNKLPYVLLRAHDGADLEAPVWSGPLTKDHLKAVLDSPVRQQMLQHLTKGESAVFLLLTSGNAKADEEAEKLLDEQLGILQKKVKLPEQDADGPQMKLGLPLRVGFKVLKISRNDPAEAAFVHMLLRCDEEILKVDEPIAFPVFGRGRMLCSLHGKDLNATQLANVVRFLCGACSCQVKELNPGVDLLLTGDWVDILEKIGGPK